MADESAPSRAVLGAALNQLAAPAASKAAPMTNIRKNERDGRTLMAASRRNFELATDYADFNPCNPCNPWLIHQNITFNANWICREGFDVAVICPAEEL